MKNSKPLLSILLPVHNSGRYLEPCLESLLKQSYKNIEILAINDFSTDNSAKILNKFKRQDKRIKIYKNVKRYGIAITLNRLLNKAKGQFVTMMSANDIVIPQRLKKQLNFLLKNQDVVAAGSQCAFINESNKKIGESQFPLENDPISQNPLHGISMQFETVLINKALLPKDLLRFNTSSKPFLYSDIFIKIIPYGKLVNLKEVLHLHRRDPKEYFADLKQNIFSLFKLWVRSKTFYSYQASLRSFFYPIIKSVYNI
jgi:glycosyltransferase involved in cell wall biosynthesis